ncbi:MAG: hypothetical protein Q8J87_13835, partial [Sediminibacterium sp.]|nr:hypothetical protein [Sediminibacterium sp.]
MQSKKLVLGFSGGLDTTYCAIYLSQEKDGKEYVIDGQQRLTTLARFMTTDIDFDSTDLLANLLQYRISDPS